MFHPAPKADDSVPLHAPLKPKITVITVCFNAEKTLDRTILSIAQQTYPNIEFIVIDGGSTDATVATIRQHPSTIDHWVSEPDRGISDAMNKGASIASGDYLIFINADDALSGPEAIATAVRRINEKPNHDLYAFCIRFGDEQRSEVRCPRPFGRRMHFKNGLFHQGVLCDARTHRRLHGYSLQYAHALDYDFFLRAYLAGMRVAVFPEVVAFMSAGGLSTRSDFTSISERLRQERSIHLSNAPGPLWRTIYTLYWMLYFPFKHIKHR